MSCPQIRRKVQISSNHCNHHHNGAHWQLCGPTPFFSHISSYYRAIVSQREGSPVAKSARQAAAEALFVRLQLGLTHALPRPLCASRAIAVPSVGDRSAIISESNAILEDCGIECHIVGLASEHSLHSDTLITQTQTSSSTMHSHAHPVCSLLH